MRNVAERRKRPHRSGAIFRVRWSDDVSGARPRHVRLRVVSRFSALQKRAKILKWRQMRAFSGSVLEWCGRAVPARLLPQEPPSGRAVPARTPAGAAPATASRPNGCCARQPRGFCSATGQLLPSSCLGRAAPADNCKTEAFPWTLSARCRLRRTTRRERAARTCSPFPRPRRWALALRRHASFEKRSVGTRGAASNACRTRCPKEPHAQRSWQHL